MKNTKKVTIEVPVNVAFFIRKLVLGHFKKLNWVQANVPDAHTRVARARENNQDLVDYLNDCIDHYYNRER